MKDIIIKELRECSRTIAGIRDKKEREAGNKLLIDTVSKVCELASTMSRGELLELELAADNLEEGIYKKYLKDMILYICDGTDPDIMEELCILRYFSSNISGYEALAYILMMTGTLDMQDGYNPGIIQEILCAMLPEEAGRIYEEHKKKEYLEDMPAKPDENIVEKYYEGDIAADPGSEFYFQLKTTDNVIRTLDNRGIMRALREIDNSELSISMKGLSGEVRKRIFDSMSSRLAVMIAEDMDFMGELRMDDIAGSATRVFNKISRLIDSGEIKCYDPETLSFIKKLFNA